MILDHTGNQIKPKTSFGFGDDKPVLDSKGRVLNPTPIEKIWGQALFMAAEKSSFIEKFIGITIVDQFGRALQYAREGKGGVIELQEDKVKIGMRNPLC